MSPAMGSKVGMGSPPLTLWLGLTRIQFSDDNRDGSRNAGLLAVPVSDTAASPMKSHVRL